MKLLHRDTSTYFKNAWTYSFVSFFDILSVYGLEFKLLDLYSIPFISLIEIRENFMLTSLIITDHFFFIIIRNSQKSRISIPLYLIIGFEASVNKFWLNL